MSARADAVWLRQLADAIERESPGPEPADARVASLRRIASNLAAQESLEVVNGKLGAAWDELASVRADLAAALSQRDAARSEVVRLKEAVTAETVERQKAWRVANEARAEVAQLKLDLAKALDQRDSAGVCANQLSAELNEHRDRYDRDRAALGREIVRLRERLRAADVSSDELAALRLEVWRQWQEAHSEQCGDVGECRGLCRWPIPEVLATWHIVHLADPDGVLVGMQKWAPSLAEVVDVTDYGAVPDGRTDCGPAFAHAIAAVHRRHLAADDLARRLGPTSADRRESPTPAPGEATR